MVYFREVQRLWTWAMLLVAIAVLAAKAASEADIGQPLYSTDVLVCQARLIPTLTVFASSVPGKTIQQRQLLRLAQYSDKTAP
jgi:nitric oxide synthase oxygenase domain/subunit